MRPLPGDDARTGRSRSTSFDNDPTPLASRRETPQMTYFIADEKAMEASQVSISAVPSGLKDLSKSSNYGVESLETTINSLALDSEDSEEKVKKARRNWKKSLGRQISKSSEGDIAEIGSPLWDLSADVSRNASPSYQRRASQVTISRPFTPLSSRSPAPASDMGSPTSRRNSDAGSYLDDIASQAIVSSGDEEREPGSEMVDSGSAPQLVMPSIRMPSRRPFTEKGKNMGRLKVLVAGDSGSGKTSLIKAIVQVCQDIVHVDPISTDNSVALSERRRSSRAKQKSTDVPTTTSLTEIYASTRSYPSWWSDLEDSRVLKRRKSMGDSVLERNLCFVDTPGYSNKTSALECIDPVIEYVESHFKKTASFEALAESEMINMLSGNGGSQVDVVLYIIAKKIKPVDLEYIRRLSHLTNVVPLIARADACSAEELTATKENILSELQAANIRPFSFGHTLGPIEQPSQHSHPYAISTAPSRDQDNMDASLLMSPDYVQPLVHSELQSLVLQLFDCDSISWLRHSAAKKFLNWRASSTPISKPQCLYRPISTPSTSQVLTAPVGATTSFALARITDHTQREERIAQIRLANWAADLQRSLQNERARFDALARSERAVWLTERLGECVQDGTIIPISQAREDNQQLHSEYGALVKTGTYTRRPKSDRSISGGGLDKQDPLGLLMLNEEVRRRSWVVLKVVSSFGVLTGLAIWAARTAWTWQENWQYAGMGVKDLVELAAVKWQ